MPRRITEGAIISLVRRWVREEELSSFDQQILQDKELPIDENVSVELQTDLTILRSLSEITFRALHKHEKTFRRYLTDYDAQLERYRQKEIKRQKSGLEALDPKAAVQQLKSDNERMQILLGEAEYHAWIRAFKLAHAEGNLKFMHEEKNKSWEWVRNWLSRQKENVVTEFEGDETAYDELVERLAQLKQQEKEQQEREAREKAEREQKQKEAAERRAQKEAVTPRSSGKRAERRKQSEDSGSNASSNGSPELSRLKARNDGHIMMKTMIEDAVDEYMDTDEGRQQILNKQPRPFIRFVKNVLAYIVYIKPECLPEDIRLIRSDSVTLDEENLFLPHALNVIRLMLANRQLVIFGFRENIVQQVVGKLQTQWLIQTTVDEYLEKSRNDFEFQLIEKISAKELHELVVKILLHFVVNNSEACLPDQARELPEVREAMRKRDEFCPALLNMESPLLLPALTVLEQIIAKPEFLHCGFEARHQQALRDKTAETKKLVLTIKREHTECITDAAVAVADALTTMPPSPGKK